jgi:hypothetical protein
LKVTFALAWTSPAECAIWSSSPVQLLPGIYLWQVDYLHTHLPTTSLQHTQIFLFRQVLSRGVNNTGQKLKDIFSSYVLQWNLLPMNPDLHVPYWYFFIWTSGLFVYLFIFQLGLVRDSTNLRIVVAGKETRW